MNDLLMSIDMLLMSIICLGISLEWPLWSIQSLFGCQVFFFVLHTVNFLAGIFRYARKANDS